MYIKVETSQCHRQKLTASCCLLPNGKIMLHLPRPQLLWYLQCVHLTLFKGHVCISQVPITENTFKTMATVLRPAVPIGSGERVGWRVFLRYQFLAREK